MAPVYDTIGEGYDMSRKADSEICTTLARLLDLRPGCHYVDIACGTGNYTMGVGDFGGEWTGFDVSQTMLAAACRKSPGGRWCRASVESTPFASNSFAGGVCILAMHHFVDLEQALAEISRILEPGAHCVAFTSTPGQMQKYWLNHYFPQMMVRARAQMPSMSKIDKACRTVGLTITELLPFAVTRQIEDRFLYSGKFDPQRYLDPEFRQGISSFRTLCSATELAMGLQVLQQDLQTSKFDALMHNAGQADGDYLYAVLKKSTANHCVQSA